MLILDLFRGEIFGRRRLKPIEALICIFMINNTCGCQKIDVRGFLGASNIDLIYIQNLLKLSFRGC